MYLPVARSSLTHLDCRSHVGGVGGVHDGFPDNGAKKNGGKIVEETKKCAGGERGVDEVKKKSEIKTCAILSPQNLGTHWPEDTARGLSSPSSPDKYESVCSERRRYDDIYRWLSVSSATSLV